MSHETVIIGAGPAGLAGAFWRLHDDPGCRVRVLEAAPRIGGWVHSEQQDGYLCEIGPQAVRPSAELDELVAALDVQDQLIPAAPAAKARWIGRAGRLLAVPMGPLQLLRTPLLSLRAKLRLLREPFVRGGDPTGESLTRFVSRRFGSETAPLVQAMVSGIFAGDADRLEVESAFPVLAEAERLGGSVLKGMRARRKAARSQAGGPPSPPKRKHASLYTFAGGMAGLVSALGSRLGNRVRTGTAVRSLARLGDRFQLQLEGGGTLAADEVALACPARASSAILKDFDPELAAGLAAIPFASLASVYLGFAARDLPATLQGFGFLLEPGEQNPVLGALYASSLFPQHAPDGHALLRVMIGGRRHPAAVDLDDRALVDLSVQTVQRYTGFRVEPTFQRVVRVRDAIPQYETGHAATMARIAARLAQHPGLSLRGNSYRAVALAGQLGRTSGTDTARAAARPQAILIP